MRFYRVSTSSIDNYVSEVRLRNFASNIKLTERSIPDDNILSKLQQQAIDLNIPFTASDISFAALSNDEAHKEAHNWLTEYVRLVSYMRC